MGVGVVLGGGFGGGGVVWVVGGAWVLTFFVFAFLQNVIDATLLKFSCHYQQIQTRSDAKEDSSKSKTMEDMVEREKETVGRCCWHRGRSCFSSEKAGAASIMVKSHGIINYCQLLFIIYYRDYNNL